MANCDIETCINGGVWKYRVQGGQRASNTAETKAEAQAIGRQMAMHRSVEHIVKKLDGTIGDAAPIRAAATRTRLADSSAAS